MANLTFPSIPNIDQFKLDNHLLGTYELIKTLENLRVHVSRPQKPSNSFKDHTAQGMRDYADKLAIYETEYAEYIIQEKNCKLHNIKVDALINSFICEDSGLNNIPEQYRNKVFSKAWSDGHSSGYYEVYQELCELVKIFN